MKNFQGNKSSKDEKAASALFAAQIDEKETNGQAVQIRVVQGKEPPHFSKIFGDRVVVLMVSEGGREILSGIK